MKRKIHSLLFGLILFFFNSFSYLFAEQALLQSLPKYQKNQSSSGDLSSVGSDTLANLMTLWAELYRKYHPAVRIQIQAAGSSTAPPALVESTASFGPMSRKMKAKEIDAFVQRHGYPPTEIKVAIDALAVYVHKDNPIEFLTLPQVDAIFSQNTRCGYETNLTHWGQLTEDLNWKGVPIMLYGRNSVSGTYGYFKKKALCRGDFKSTVNEQPGSASVVQSISTSKNAIGYSGIGYRTSSVKLLPLFSKKLSKPVLPNPQNSADRSYPLARFLYIYVNKKPNTPLPPLELEFLRMVLSYEGQSIVLKDGYVPIPLKVLKKQLKKLSK